MAQAPPEVMFYHLERSSLDEALPRLLEKTLQRGWKAMVQTTTPEHATALDAHLWVWKDDAFLPHAVAGDARFADDAAMQPIWISTDDDAPNDADVLFLVDGAERDTIDGFTRCVVIFDGRDEEGLAQARAYWKTLKAADYPMTYWQEVAKGKWEQKGN